MVNHKFWTQWGWWWCDWIMIILWRKMQTSSRNLWFTTLANYATFHSTFSNRLWWRLLDDTMKEAVLSLLLFSLLTSIHIVTILYVYELWASNIWKTTIRLIDSIERVIEFVPSYFVHCVWTSHIRTDVSASDSFALTVAVTTTADDWLLCTLLTHISIADNHDIHCGKYHRHPLKPPDVTYIKKENNCE